ncbi:hypothetical protein [Marinobacter segnicrescens]|uniref:hypothetical protein n=1 Tax=Marinobacter segnicrescens TaxID=430453 RepID=UPI003A91D683
MERRDQLRNVAFGGDWSEQIPDRERIVEALAALTRAVNECQDHDPCASNVLIEVDHLCAQIARGTRMAASWRKAGAVPEPGVRQSMLAQILKTIRSGIGEGVNK